MTEAMKQLTLFEKQKCSGLASIIDPFDKRMAKVEEDIARMNCSGVPRWRILEYFELYGQPPQGNETL